MRYQDLEAEYATLWDGMTVTRLQTSIDTTAAKIVANRPRYEAVSAITRVPWFVIGIIHALESGLRFDCHLHNGDPLTAKTKCVPAARPPTGVAPYTFEQSAADALLMKGYDKIDSWPVERIAWALERYNGWGYRRHHPETLSPYLWSGSNHYTSGKYVADGKWSKSAVSQQSGAMPLLKAVAALCPDIVLVSAHGATMQSDEHSPASNRSADVSTSPVPTVVGGATVATTVGGVTMLIDPTAATTAIAAWQGLGRTIGDASQWAMSSKMTLVVVAAGVVYALIAFVGPKIWRRA